MTEIEQLAAENPTATDSELRIWLNAFKQYQEAQRGINQAGLLAADPNGKILENPMLKVQERCVRLMGDCGRIKNTAFMWDKYHGKEK